MRNDGFLNLPILVVTSNTPFAERIKSFFLSNEDSGNKVYTADNFTEALSQHLSAGELYASIFVEQDEFSPELIIFIETIERNNNGPVVIISDDENVISSCRERGKQFFLSTKNIDENQVANMIAPAWSHFQLQQSVKKLEDHYHLAEQRFNDVANNFSDWLWEVDKNICLTFSSSQKRPVKEAEVGSKFTNCFLPDEKSRIEDDFHQLFALPKQFSDVEYWSFDAYGTKVCWSLSGVPVTNKDGTIVGFRGTAKDVSNSKASVDQLYYLSNNDQLTGLFNRSRFYEEMQRQVRKSSKTGENCALVVIDLDKFKYINDTHGHDFGDKIIMHIGKVLKDHVRSGDFIARTGGDEFAVILTNVREDDVEDRANAILRGIISNPYVQGSKPVTITASLGVIKFPAGGRTADELLSRADVAMNRAKELGRNRLFMFDILALEGGGTARKLESLDFIAQCLDNNSERMLLHFQPIVPLNGGTNNNFYEVLVRMLDENGEIVAPIKFIETAEEYGLVSRIDQHVARKAIDILQKSHASGQKMILSINLSGRTFDDDAVISEIEQRVSQAKLPAGSLVIEITETAVLRDLEKVKEIMKRLKAKGVHFALDDCGVGYSSLNYIKNLDLDIIKIDGSFVRELHKSENDDAFVRALRDVARRLKIVTVAEMVEKEETIEHLKRLGIDYGQGFAFGMPGPKLEKDEKIH